MSVGVCRLLARPRFLEMRAVANGGYIQCLRRLEMSRWAPDRNVRAGRLGSGGGRARSLYIAQSPTAGRCTGSAASSLFSECALAREARRISSLEVDIENYREEGEQALDNYRCPTELAHERQSWKG